MTAVPDVSPEMAAFLDERHLATLTTLRADGSPHVVPVGFTYDVGDGLVRVITFAASTTPPRLHGPSPGTQHGTGRRRDAPIGWRSRSSSTR